MRVYREGKTPKNAIRGMTKASCLKIAVSQARRRHKTDFPSQSVTSWQLRRKAASSSRAAGMTFTLDLKTANHLITLVLGEALRPGCNYKLTEIEMNLIGTEF